MCPEWLPTASAPAHGRSAAAAQTALWPLVSRQVYLEDERLGTELATPDGSSWAAASHEHDGADGYRVHRAGTRRVWTELERLHQRWTEHGSPRHDRFGVTVTAGRVTLWLDQQKSVWNSRSLAGWQLAPTPAPRTPPVHRAPRRPGAT